MFWDFNDLRGTYSPIYMNVSGKDLMSAISEGVQFPEKSCKKWALPRGPCNYNISTNRAEV